MGQSTIQRLMSRVPYTLSRLGMTARRHRSREEQERFLRTLQPVQTEHELVRIGGDGDGGYLVPDDLDGVVACFSPGVEATTSFEEQMLARGIRTFQIDGSITDTPLKHPLNDFERKWLGIVSDETTTTLDDWVKVKVGDASGDLLLQIDIEGNEWLPLAQVSEETLLRFRVIVAELHGLDLGFVQPGMQILTPVLERLRRHFDVVHLHANNCMPIMHSRHFSIAPLLEVTWLRKDRSSQRAPVKSLPHPLDRDCVPTAAPVTVPMSMYSLDGAAAPSAHHIDHR